MIWKKVGRNQFKGELTAQEAQQSGAGEGGGVGEGRLRDKLRARQAECLNSDWGHQLQSPPQPSPAQHECSLERGSQWDPQ